MIQVCVTTLLLEIVNTNTQSSGLLGLRILHLASLGEGFRESVRQCHLFAWLFLSLQDPNSWQGSPGHYFQPHHWWLFWRPRRHSSQKELVLSWWRSLFDNAHDQAFPDVQNQVHSRCHCSYCRTGGLVCVAFATSALDQFDGSQSVRATGFRRTLRYLLFLDAICRSYRSCWHDRKFFLDYVHVFSYVFLLNLPFSDFTSDGGLCKCIVLALIKVNTYTCLWQLIYLIIVVATGQAALPTISLIMIAVVYGLQAIIFILKREFMLVGWMVVYIISWVFH